MRIYQLFQVSKVDNNIAITLSFFDILAKNEKKDKSEHNYSFVQQIDYQILIHITLYMNI